jgi:hypothetical protein
VSRAFAIGWQMASLSCIASLEAGDDDEHDVSPGVRPSTFSPSTRVHQIRAGLYKLASHLTAAGDEPVETHTLDEALEADSGARKRKIDEFHAEVSDALGAADFRLGKAYELGYALAETCLKPEDRATFDAAFGPRVVELKNSLADLASTFPPHASRAVVLSLRSWESWAAEPTLDGHQLDWDMHGAAVRTALRRQGELWRGLLSDEKQGADMLGTEHYLRAASTLVAEMTSTIWLFLRPVAIPLGGAVLVLAIGIALLVLTGGIAQVLGAIAAIISALGITGAGFRARLGRATAQLETRLWNAELDRAIAEAVLIGPKGWPDAIAQDDVPATGPTPKVTANQETLKAFRQALSVQEGDQSAKDIKKAKPQRLEEVKGFLTSNAEFIAADGSKVAGRNDIAGWLLENVQAAERIATPPQLVKAAEPGVLLTYVGTRDAADIWWLREGKIRRWRAFTNRDEARKQAGLAS